jgi:hypothetical protein
VVVAYKYERSNGVAIRMGVPRFYFAETAGSVEAHQTVYMIGMDWSITDTTFGGTIVILILTGVV